MTEVSLSGKAKATGAALHMANIGIHKFAIFGDNPELEKVLMECGIAYERKTPPIMLMDSAVLVFPDSVFDASGKVKAELISFLRGE